MTEPIARDRAPTPPITEHPANCLTSFVRTSRYLWLNSVLKGWELVAIPWTLYVIQKIALIGLSGLTKATQSMGLKSLNFHAITLFSPAFTIFLSLCAIGCISINRLQANREWRLRLFIPRRRLTEPVSASMQDPLYARLSVKDALLTCSLSLFLSFLLLTMYPTHALTGTVLNAIISTSFYLSLFDVLMNTLGGFIPTIFHGLPYFLTLGMAAFGNMEHLTMTLFIATLLQTSLTTLLHSVVNSHLPIHSLSEFFAFPNSITSVRSILPLLILSPVQLLKTMYSFSTARTIIFLLLVFYLFPLPTTTWIVLRTAMHFFKHGLAWPKMEELDILSNAHNLLNNIPVSSAARKKLLHSLDLAKYTAEDLPNYNATITPPSS